MLTGRITYLAEAPRRVPWSVIAATLPGTIGSFGAIFFILGMVFVAIFAGDVRPIDEVRLNASSAAAIGTVTQVRETDASENDEAVYEYDFTFRTRTETPVTAKSYATGRHWAEGDQVTVMYLPDKPTVAVFEGARRTIFPWWAAIFVGIFPLIGGAMLLSGLFNGWRQIRLLEIGKIAYARSISAQPTNTSINNQPVLKYTYEFQADDGQTYTGASKSLPKAQLGDEANEPVLYFLSNPKRSMLLDTVPLRYALNTDVEGQWISDGNPWPILWSTLIGLGAIGSWVFVITRLI